MANNKVLTIDITNESITIVEVTASQKKQTYIHNALILKRRKVDMKTVIFGIRT